MRKHRIRKKSQWDDRGVSEVIGTILTLTITVVLFSSIILMVNQFPPPGDNAYTQFSGKVDPLYGDWAQGAYVNVTCIGGSSLGYEFTDIVLTVDNNTYVLKTRGLHFGNNYGINGNDTDWDVSETWSVRLPSGYVNATSLVGMVVVDNDKDMVVWSGVLHGGEQDLAPITTDAWADVDPETTRHDPIRFGQDFYFFAEVSDPNDDLNTSAVWVDMSSIGLSERVNMTDPDLDGTFEANATMGGSIPVGYYPLTVHATDLSGHSSARSFLVPVGQEIGFVPNLAIQMDNIVLSDYSPVHGETIKIEAIVQNFGLKSTWADIYFYDGETGQLIGQDEILISGAPDEITTSIYWRAAPGGNHTLTVVAVARDGAEPASLQNDNSNYTNVSVLPTILLVDDDAHINDGSDGDTVRFMRSSMASCGFSYDFVQVPVDSDGPAFDYGDYQMEDYDIVIWMTGYETTNTLTSNDQENLAKYLTNVSANRSNTGSLWLIGSGIFQDPAVTTTSFMQDYLHIFSASDVSTSTADILGLPGHIVTNEWASEPFEIIERVAGETDIYEVNPMPDAEDMFLMGGNPVAMNYENASIDERVVVTPWEFSRIADAGDQTQVAFKTILWLGNITSVLGTDLAISGQVISPSVVFFGETVNISATVRNNGMETLYGVEVQMFIDDEPVEIPGVSPVQINISGFGGSKIVYMDMKAEVVGDHIIKWKVDPNNMIAETNEDNNEVSDYLNAATLTVEFRILVVDDDESPNNGGSKVNDTAFVADSLLFLGYVFENHTVLLNSDGPGIDTLSNYSAILWVTGNASDSSALTATDQFNVQTYMTTVNGYFWLMGSNCLGDTLDTFEEDFLQIDSVAPNQPLPPVLEGVEGNPITHGMQLQTGGQASADIITPGPGATGILTDNGNYYAVWGDTYRSLVSTFSFSNLTDEDERNELLYLAFHWFGKPDDRSELRITDIDFRLSDTHPILGDAYILTATVYNVGGQDNSALVRFMDGDTLIGSDSVTVSMDGQTSAEVIWRPLHAGPRIISVFVDPGVTAAPGGDVPEIFEWFNNNVSVNTYVYYFWDDMEDPSRSSERWSHYSTIININGESPLDHFSGDYLNLDTDVISTWNSTATYGVTEVTDTFRTYDSSYYMEEGTGLFGEANVLLSLAIDDSKSMTQRVDSLGRTWLEAAKDAAKTLLDQLSDNSVCVSIWDFKGNNERRWAGPDVTSGGRLATDPAATTEYDRLPIRLGDTYTSIINGSLIDGRQYIRDEIDLMDNPSGTTILWDSIGEAYLDNEWWRASYPDLQPAVIVLSDGADSQASDQSGIAANRIEGGSDYWVPWDDINNGLQDYGDNSRSMHFGKYTFDWSNPSGTTQWLEAGGHGGSMQYTNRLGLLNADEKIFTIGLGLEHHDPPYEPEINTYPGEVMDNTNAFYEGTDGAYYSTNPEIYRESGTLEYNLWKIANSTGAEYFYAPSADDLENIFEQLGLFLASGFNQTRSVEPGSETRAVNNNSDKRAVTETFSLEGMDSAELSFWHKYRMLQGGNGGFLQVAYKGDGSDGDTTDWDYKYIIPPGEYTGGLYYPIDVYDDFGNLIKWCWNGVSSNNGYNWDYVSVDILDFVPPAYRSEVRVVFNYTQFGGGTGDGWWLDDVKVKVSRMDSSALDANSKDLWNLTNMTQLGLSAHSGNYSWMNMNVTTGYMKEGIDNSLVTMPIDLTRARTVVLSAYLKFNINTADGMPPDGFRVEISTDGQTTWNAVNLGARAAWGVSGTGADMDDGELDGKTYAGMDPDGDGWVEAGTLTRLNVDLSAFRGSQAHIRFRMVTNSNPAYLHYDDPMEQGGFFLDDVMVKGETI